jgi:co-chaperonin GroES (HSP10)
MAELLKINVTRKELDEGTIPTNQVLCEMFYQSEGAKTKLGIVYGINTDLTYADSENPDDNSAHAADMAEVALRIYKLPQKLYYNPDDTNKSMSWDTDMELKVGDTVWTNPIDALNAVTLVCEGKLYKFIPYADLIVARRIVFENSIPEVWTIMLNGYVLCEQVNKKSLSELDVTSEDKVDPTKGIVAYIGKPNKRYLNDAYVDFLDLKVGDEVLFDKRYSPILLERQLYASKFDSEKLYVVVPRRKIAMVINKKA